MSWAKRNLYFLISCIVAVVLLGAAGWYCWSSYNANNANWDKLKANYDQMKQFADKKPGPGNDQTNNIQTAKDQTEEAKKRVAELEKFFTPVKGVPDTNKFNDRMLAFAVRETVGQLRKAAQEKSVMLPGMAMAVPGMPAAPGAEFDFSFTLQMGKTIYDPNAAEMLSKQMGEVKLICDVLFGARILAVDSIQREHTSDDSNPQGGMGGQPDYTDSISLTNGNTVISPYQVTFECFTPQLGAVLASFANQSHTIVVKTLNVQPSDLTGMEGMRGPMNAYDMTAMQAANRAGVATTIIDEKKLKVIMLLDFVKITPEQGK